MGHITNCPKVGFYHTMVQYIVCSCFDLLLFCIYKMYVAALAAIREKRSTPLDIRS